MAATRFDPYRWPTGSRRGCTAEMCGSVATMLSLIAPHRYVGQLVAGAKNARYAVSRSSSTSSAWLQYGGIAPTPRDRLYRWPIHSGYAFDTTMAITAA